MDTTFSQQVLVLNRLWQAVNICTPERAVSLLYQGHAAAIDSNEGSFNTLDFNQWLDHSQTYEGKDCYKTVSLKFRVPKVILLLMFDRLPRKEVKLTRQSVFERDDYTCQYCGDRFDRKDLNLDHVLPRDKGGQTTWENIVCSCIPCNSKKANRTPIQARMQLLKRPKRPKWRPLLHIYHHRIPEESWRHFLDIDSWKVEFSD
jgi:5-methylcytosine-specific restriction endonuclease McrA